MHALVEDCPRCRANPFRQTSYSQDGEDRVLAKIFETQANGFYVDIGAHHPQRFSNTQLFYERGWRGLNVDALPGTAERFAAARPRDITLECGIGREPGSVEFFLYDEPAYNSFSSEVAEFIRKRGFPKLLSTRKVPVHTLAQVLERHLPPGQTIDFLSVDVESWDLQVLQSNDWTTYRPKVLVVECSGDLEVEATSSPVGQFLRAQGYRLHYMTTQSAFYLEKR